MVQPATSVYVVCWYVGMLVNGLVNSFGSKALVHEWRVPHSAWRVPVSGECRTVHQQVT